MTSPSPADARLRGGGGPAVGSMSAPSLPTAPLSIVVIDDDEVFRRQLQRAFERRGHACLALGDPTTLTSDLLRLPNSPAADLCLVDLRMPRSGIDVLGQLRQQWPGTTIVVLTGFGSIATAVEAIRTGADDYLVKPADIDQILTAYQRLHSSRGSMPLLEGQPGARGDNATTLAQSTQAMQGADSPPSLDRLEWEYIQQILKLCDGNISRAARCLGMHRRTLQRKLTKLPMD